MPPSTKDKHSQRSKVTSPSSKSKKDSKHERNHEYGSDNGDVMMMKKNFIPIPKRKKNKK